MQNSSGREDRIPVRMARVCDAEYCVFASHVCVENIWVEMEAILVAIPADFPQRYLKNFVF